MSSTIGIYHAVLCYGTLLCCPCCLLAQDPSGEPPPDTSLVLPSFSLENGLYSESPLLRPGKADFLYRRRPHRNEYNFIWWSPLFKGGIGTWDLDGEGTTDYFGGYLRPLAAWPDKGDLIIGSHGVNREAGSDAFEIQGEYRFPMGLGFGGGTAQISNSENDFSFGKVTYRNRAWEWNYILEVQAQDVDGEVSPGGYGAVYNQELMAVGGTDGEQWRTAFGFVSPELNPMLRPAFEVLYVDSSIGDLDGPKFLFVNATLKFSMGFLSHPARLGRAMGPQGLEYGNPLGFLRPTWNRRLDVWELGGLLDYRLVRTEAPDDSVAEKHEALFYPFHLDSHDNLLDAIFVGGSYARIPGDEDTPGILAGISRKLGFLKISAAMEYETETDDITATVGIIDAF